MDIKHFNDVCCRLERKESYSGYCGIGKDRTVVFRGKLKDPLIEKIKS